MEEVRRIEMSIEQIDALVARVKSGTMREGDVEAVGAMAETIKALYAVVDKKSSAVKRLLRMLFGAPTETSKNVLGEAQTSSKQSGDSSAGTDKRKDRSKDKSKGHGRNGAATYTGAERVTVPHAHLSPGDRCPECPKGKVYPLKPPATVLCIRGSPPLQAVCYELERLRCNLCGAIFTADPPPGCGKNKYDETVGSMIALLKYGSGFPFHRLEKLQSGFGVPLPASTQWEIVNRKADTIRPAYEQLIREAAQGTVLHNDDTAAKILEFMGEPAHPPADSGPSRTGMFTTGMLSRLGEHTIALYATGRKHAGENLADVLSKRETHRAPPIQMCDALSRNLPKPFEVILANCMAHARRNFVELFDVFPEECRSVLETLGQVYHNDAITKKHRMTDTERLAYHQAQSAPLMNALHASLSELLHAKIVEPNSGLGTAFSYMLNHWTALTRFLHVPGAPLDNNICERALKRAILHRKNSLFFKTQHGASVGDLYMSLIHTCILNGVDPFDYLTELEKHSVDIAAHPERWMPWNYRRNLAK